MGDNNKSNLRMLSLTKDSMEYDAASGFPGFRYRTWMPFRICIYDYKYTTVKTVFVIKNIYR